MWDMLALGEGRVRWRVDGRGREQKEEGVAASRIDLKPVLFSLCSHLDPQRSQCF